LLSVHIEDKGKMFYREIDDELQLAMIMPHLAEALYTLVDRNRDYLREWLPWLDDTTEQRHVEDFIKSMVAQMADGRGLACLVVFRGNIVGVVSYNTIVSSTRTGYIGYWLDQDHNGKGIMTKSVEKLIEIGFDELGLRKVEIRCAVGNTKSRAIPERLGLKEEAVIRNAENLYGRYVDHAVYGVMKDEWTPIL
jgi:ribosomal-protein-serine acetyltransferase